MLDYSRAGDIAVAVAVAVAVVVVVVAAAGVVVVVVTIRILIPMIIVLFFHHRGFVIPVGCSACGGGGCCRLAMPAMVMMSPTVNGRK